MVSYRSSAFSALTLADVCIAARIWIKSIFTDKRGVIEICVVPAATAL